MKSFVERSRREADGLADALADLDCRTRIALTHYSPIAATLEGEPREIYPFLGSHLLADAIDRTGADSRSTDTRIAASNAAPHRAAYRSATWPCP